MSWRSFKKKFSRVINMNDYVPDMLEQFEQYEAEQDRLERRRRQEEIACEMADWED